MFIVVQVNKFRLVSLYVRYFFRNAMHVFDNVGVFVHAKVTNESSY